MGNPVSPDVTPAVDGVYPDVPAEHYHRWNACSASRLQAFKRSPLHCRAQIDGDVEQTDAMAFGTMVHSAILEPETFRRTYGRKAPGKAGDRRTKEGKARWAELVERFGEANILDAKTFDQVARLCSSVYGHPAAHTLLSGAGPIELSLIWTDKATGVRCKCRIDKHATDLELVADLKTTRDASEGAFQRSLYNFGYFRQGAMNLRGCAALGLEASAWCCVAVEKDRPHAVAVYSVEDEALLRGTEQIDRLLPRWAACVEANEWPGYSDEIRDITLPAWAWAQTEGV